MIELISAALPYKVLISHILLGFILLAMLSRRGIGRDIVLFIGRHATWLGFLVSLGAVVGSLFYSEVMGFEACSLCWWQRVFLYPLPIIFAISIWKKDNSVWRYVVPLTLVTALLALYQSYVYMGGASFLACTAEGGACSRVYVKEFGYITIPLMSLTICAYILVIAWIRKIYSNENSNS